MSSVRRRLDYDVLRVCSMVAVVYLHTAAGALRTPQNLPVWHFSNALTALFTTAVPLFFMLSGALLLKDEKTADLSTLFRRRLPKIILPLLAWSAVVLVLTGLRTGWGTAWDKAFVFLQSPVLVPYWFLYALVPMYLVAPLLKKMSDGLSPALLSPGRGPGTLAPPPLPAVPLDCGHSTLPGDYPGHRLGYRPHRRL